MKKGQNRNEAEKGKGKRRHVLGIKKPLQFGRRFQLVSLDRSHGSCEATFRRKMRRKE